ncbi:transmembrane protein, putative [Medicago truncatula]|uniref:Transmembrane protein, putative n=1 Tax=Medicago truncatula TaxID=3880 RepID=A0A072TIE9_MEDTR|nr:transmembrane protein, putative [Medicago truncatula]
MEKKPDQINRGKRKQQSDDKNAMKSGKKMKKKPDQKKQQSAGEESDERKLPYATIPSAIFCILIAVILSVKLLNLEFSYCISPSASFYSLSVTFVRLV